MSIIFRPIEEKDNKAIAEVIRNVFREFNIHTPGTVFFDPTTDDLYSLFREQGSVYWIALENDVIIGGCGVYPTKGLPDGCAEFVKFYLSQSQRGKGTGRMLMEKTFESAKKLGYRMLYLESLPELSRAINLYEKAGFKFVSEQMGESGHCGCKVWMIKELD
jgi:putative acetyltransferase